jgi:hypothetical protein
VKRPRHHFGTDPAYPLQGFTILGPAYKEPTINIIMDPTELLEGLDEIHRRLLKLNEMASPRALEEALTGRIVGPPFLVDVSVHDCPTTAMATITPIHRSTT